MCKWADILGVGNVQKKGLSIPIPLLSSIGICNEADQISIQHDKAMDCLYPFYFKLLN